MVRLHGWTLVGGYFVCTRVQLCVMTNAGELTRIRGPSRPELAALALLAAAALLRAAFCPAAPPLSTTNGQLHSWLCHPLSLSPRRPNTHDADRTALPHRRQVGGDVAVQLREAAGLVPDAGGGAGSGSSSGCGSGCGPGSGPGSGSGSGSDDEDSVTELGMGSSSLSSLSPGQRASGPTAALL